MSVLNKRRILSINKEVKFIRKLEKDVTNFHVIKNALYFTVSALWNKQFYLHLKVMWYILKVKTCEKMDFLLYFYYKDSICNEMDDFQ